MHDDDATIGRILSRRDAVALLGASGFAAVAGCGTSRAAPSASTSSAAAAPQAGCVVRPAQTAGPYFVDERLNRADIRPDPSNGSVKAGAALALTINVSRISGGACAPVRGAMVDLWQCDAEGVYSDAQDRLFNTVGQKFLRGYQLTGADGNASFVTIYPGWYPTRAVHVHFKIRSPQDARPGYDFTSQLYFDDAFTDQVHARGVYAARGMRTVRNERDNIYRTSGGEQLMLDVRPAGDGYAAAFAVALQA